MSPENVEIVRRGFEALARRDYDALFSMCDPEIEVVLPSGGINTGILRGHQALRDLLEEYLAAFADVRWEAERFFDAGDSVVVFIHMTGRGRGSGIAVEFRPAHLTTLVDGRVTRVQAFPDGKRTEALEAAGLATP